MDGALPPLRAVLGRHRGVAARSRGVLRGRPVTSGKLTVPPLLAWAVLSGCGAPLPRPDGGAPWSFPAEPLQAQLGETAGLRVEVRSAPSQPPARGVNALQLTIA